MIFETIIIYHHNGHSSKCKYIFFRKSLRGDPELTKKYLRLKSKWGATKIIYR